MIKGNYVGLRAVERKDLQQLLIWRNNPEFRKFFREYRELSFSNQEQWYEGKVLNDPYTRMFSIINEADELIGACGLCYIDWINRNADFSIYIGKDSLYIDDTYAIEAGTVLLKYGFEELNLHRIWAEIYSLDNKKIVFLEKLGFKLEGKHRETHWTEGRWVDSLFYSILGNEFQALNND